MNEKNIGDEEKKEKIVYWLNEKKRLSTSRFVGILGTNYEIVKRLLDELEIEGKVVKQEETTAVYWVLKDVR